MGNEVSSANYNMGYYLQQIIANGGSDEDVLNGIKKMNNLIESNGGGPGALDETMKLGPVTIDNFAARALNAIGLKLGNKATGRDGNMDDLLAPEAYLLSGVGGGGGGGGGGGMAQRTGGMIPPRGEYRGSANVGNMQGGYYSQVGKKLDQLSLQFKDLQSRIDTIDWTDPAEAQKFTMQWDMLMKAIDRLGQLVQSHGNAEGAINQRIGQIR